MNSQEAFRAFVNPLSRRFTVPSGLNAEGFLLDVAESMTGYTEHQLSAAAGEITRTRTQRVFPTIAECRAAAERVSASPPVARQMTAHETEPESIERRRWGVRELVRRSGMAEQADREGWLIVLLDQAAIRGRLPSPYELDEARYAARDAEELSARGLGPMFESLRQLRSVMHDKAHKIVFGGQHDGR